MPDEPDAVDFPGLTFGASNRGAGGGTLFLAGGGIDNWLCSPTLLLESFEATDCFSTVLITSSMLFYRPA